MDIWVVSTFLAIMNNSIRKAALRTSFWVDLYFQVFQPPGVEWYLELQCEQLPECFPMLLHRFTFPPAMHENSVPPSTSDASPLALEFPSGEARA